MTSEPSLVVAEKRCGECGVVKPLSAFHRDRGSKDGRRWACADCSTVRVRASAARRRAEMGEEAWAAQQREIAANSRKKRGMESERQYNRAKHAATRQLIEAHRKEYDALLARARYEIEQEAGGSMSTDGEGTNDDHC